MIQNKAQLIEENILSIKKTFTLVILLLVSICLRIGGKFFHNICFLRRKRHKTTSESVAIWTSPIKCGLQCLLGKTTAVSVSKPTTGDDVILRKALLIFFCSRSLVLDTIWMFPSNCLTGHFQISCFVRFVPNTETMKCSWFNVCFVVPNLLDNPFIHFVQPAVLIIIFY